MDFGAEKTLGGTYEKLEFESQCLAKIHSNVWFAAAPSAACLSDSVPVHVLIEQYFSVGHFSVILDRKHGPG